MAAPSQIAHYQITSKLGEGGMGAVYRAIDTKLHRDVAIKVLPAAFAADSARIARFEREALVLASLNHPNIAAIYGIEQGAIVMELVDGADLTGPVPIETAIDYARQIAAGLEAAHEKGIVHRDLKPANIKVTPGGQIKILDFGLARASEAAAQPGDPSISPTLSLGMTEAGVILGTAAYMSPEQARGRTVDKRADIWAFGVVLHEMLTGKRLFEGEDLTETLAAVVKERPDLSAVPAPVRRLIERCLEKDPRKRLRDIGDMELLLGDGSAAAAAGAAPQSSRLPWMAAGALTAALGVVLWAPWRGEKQAQLSLTRLDVDLGEDVSLPARGPSGSAIAISADGTRLVYVSGSGTKLFMRRLDQARATELPGTEGANYPFFSPDGQWVGFTKRDKLMKISVEGGPAVPFGDIPNFGNASWGEDGHIIVSDVMGKGLLRYAAAGGPPQPLPGFSPKDAPVAPQILPGGKAVLFTAVQANGDVDRYTVEVLTLSDGHRKILARGGASARYVGAPGRPGHLIYVYKTALFAVPFDLDKLETRGTPVPVLDGVAISRSSGLGQFDCSPGADWHGVFVYRKAGANAGDLSTLQWLDSAGKKELSPLKPGGFLYSRLSPDGERVALTATEGGRTDIWVYDPRRDVRTRLSFGDGYFIQPAWSPDGRYIVYESMGKGIFQARADGSGQPHLLMESNAGQYPYSFAPDGKRLAYTEFAEARGQIWTVPLQEQGGQLKAGKPEPVLTSNFNDEAPAFSPDGRWLAYVSDESGAYEVYVRAFPPSAGPGGKWQISNSGGSAPRWSRNGHQLLYASGVQVMAVDYSVRGDSFVAGKPRVWIAKMAEVVGAWDVAPDGRRALVLSHEESAEGSKPEHEVVFLENFFDYLRQRAPMGK